MTDQEERIINIILAMNRKELNLITDLCDVVSSSEAKEKIIRHVESCQCQVALVKKKEYDNKKNSDRKH